MKDWSRVLRQITMLSQLSLSLITPLLMCLGACYLLNVKAGVGLWVYLPGFVLGLGSSATVAWKLYRSMAGREKKNKRKGKAFNGHL